MPTLGLKASISLQSWPCVDTFSSAREVQIEPSWRSLQWGVYYDSILDVLKVSVRQIKLEPEASQISQVHLVNKHRMDLIRFNIQVPQARQIPRIKTYVITE